MAFAKTRARLLVVPAVEGHDIRSAAFRSLLLQRLQPLQFPDAWRGPGLEEIQDDVAPTHPVQREAFSAFILDDDVRGAVAAAAGRFVRPGKELCRPLSGMSDPGPDVTIDLPPGNPCRQRRKSPALVDLVDLPHRRLTRSAPDLAANDQPVLGDLDGGEGRGGGFIKDLQTADELL